MDSNNFDLSKVQIITKPIRDPAREFINGLKESESRWATFWLKVKKAWWLLKYKIKYRGKEITLEDDQ
jgi:hypothetical protein